MGKKTAGRAAAGVGSGKGMAGRYEFIREITIRVPTRFTFLRRAGAEMLGINPSTLRSRLDKLGVSYRRRGRERN